MNTMIFKTACALVIMLCIGRVSHAQTNAVSQANTSTLVAAKIADRMKDSLQLSTSQRNSVHDINLQINLLKQDVRSRFTNRDSLTIHIQKIENSRDSLYKPVLTGQQFNQYKQKKRFLITAN